MLEPEHAIIGNAVPARRDEVDIAVSVHIARDEFVVHASLPPRDVVTRPVAARRSGVLEPREPAERVVGRHVAVHVAGTATVAAHEDIGGAVPLMSAATSPTSWSGRIVPMR